MPPSALARFTLLDWAPTPLAAIVWRELLTTLRQPRYSGLLLVAASVQFLIAMPTLLSVAGGQMTPALATTGVLSIQCAALLFVVFIVIPALAAVSLAAERHQMTDDLLRTALFHPATVVAGKLLAVFTVFVVFHLGLLPFGAFVYFFAGIEIQSAFQVTLLLYTTAFTHALIGIGLSYAIESPSRTVFAAYAYVASLYILPLAYHHWGQTFNFTTITPSPPPDPISLLSQLIAGDAGWPECIRLFIHQSAGVILLLVLCLASQSLTRVPWGRVTLQNRAPHDRRATFGPIPDWGNPVFHRERRRSPMLRPRWAVTIFTLTVVVALLFNVRSVTALNVAWDALDAGVFVLYVLIPLLVVERCAREMDPETLLHLRMTLLSSQGTLNGIAMALFVSLGPILLGLVAASAASLLLRDYWTLTPLTQTPSNLESIFFNTLVTGAKAAMAITLCLTFVQFRNPSTTDLATGLLLSYGAIASAELASYGLGIGSVNGGQLAAAAVVITVFVGIAQSRFEDVFDQEVDLHSADYLEKRFR